MVVYKPSKRIEISERGIMKRSMLFVTVCIGAIVFSGGIFDLAAATSGGCHTSNSFNGVYDLWDSSLQIGLKID